MKKSLFKSMFLAIMLLLSGCSIDGTISDENSTAIKNAKVVATFNGQTQEVLSDDKGYYSINDVEMGDTVALHVSKAGYVSQNANVDYSQGDMSEDFVLIADEIKIVGAKGLIQSNPNTQSTSNIYVTIQNQITTTNDDGSFVTNNPKLYEDININMPLVIQVSIVNSNKDEYSFTQTIIPSEHLLKVSRSTEKYYVNFPTITLNDDIVDVCSVTSKNNNTSAQTTNSTIEEGTICPAIYAPVCASVDVQCITTPCEKIEQTFSNQCVMNANKNASFLYAGKCQKTIAPPVDEEPIKVCPLNAAPVCGLVSKICNETTCDSRSETFSNMCFLNISENTTFLYVGQCKEVKPPITEKPESCPNVYETKICPAIYAPVCADVNNKRRTFASKCVMRATKEAHFLFSGECVAVEPQ